MSNLKLFQITGTARDRTGINPKKILLIFQHLAIAIWIEMQVLFQVFAVMGENSESPVVPEEGELSNDSDTNDLFVIDSTPTTIQNGMDVPLYEKVMIPFSTFLVCLHEQLG